MLVRARYTRQVSKLGASKVLVASVDGGDLKMQADLLRDLLGSSMVALASVVEGKVQLVVGVSADLVGRVRAGDRIHRG